MEAAVVRLKQRRNMGPAVPAAALRAVARLEEGDTPARPAAPDHSEGQPKMT